MLHVNPEKYIHRTIDRGKIRHFQGFKKGNLTQFLVGVFTLNAHPIGQTLGMAGSPQVGGRIGQNLVWYVRIPARSISFSYDRSRNGEM